MCPPTMPSREASSRVSELRHYARCARRPWYLKTRYGWLKLPLIDLSPGGAKVRLTEPLSLASVLVRRAHHASSRATAKGVRDRLSATRSRAEPLW
jgi:hypothetical protein